MEELFRQMKQEQDEFNSKNAIPQIQIAYGYAEFDPETDRDIEDTRSRADDKMYQKKREIKADTNENKRTEALYVPPKPEFELYLDRQAMDVIVYVLIYKKTEYK